MSDRVICFDLDGTLTHPGHDLFFNTMKSVLEYHQFSKICEVFTTGGKNLETSSTVITMCHEYLSLKCKDWDQMIYKTGYLLMESLIDSGHYHENAFKLIRTLKEDPSVIHPFLIDAKSRRLRY